MTDALHGAPDNATSNGPLNGALTGGLTDEVIKVLIEALSDSALRSLARLAVFGRAKDYVTSTAITVIAEEGGAIPAVYAEIIGSDIYLTEVWSRNGSVGGGCGKLLPMRRRRSRRFPKIGRSRTAPYGLRGRRMEGRSL